MAKEINFFIVDDNATTRIMVFRMLAQQVFDVGQDSAFIEVFRTEPRGTGTFVLTSKVDAQQTYRFTMLEDVQKACDVINDGASPDVVWTDYNMPGGDGDVLVRAIRAKASDFAQPLIIACSGQETSVETDSVKQIFVREGANAFLSKPFSKSNVLDALSEDKIGHESVLSKNAKAALTKMLGRAVQVAESVEADAGAVSSSAASPVVSAAAAAAMAAADVAGRQDAAFETTGGNKEASELGAGGGASSTTPHKPPFKPSFAASSSTTPAAAAAAAMAVADDDARNAKEVAARKAKKKRRRSKAMSGGDNAERSGGGSDSRRSGGDAGGVSGR